jgi:hypothetical protein
MKIEITIGDKEVHWIYPLAILHIIGLVLLIDSGWKYWIFLFSYMIIFFIFTYKIKIKGDKNE